MLKFWFLTIFACCLLCPISCLRWFQNNDRLLVEVEPFFAISCGKVLRLFLSKGAQVNVFRGQTGSHATYFSVFWIVFFCWVGLGCLHSLSVVLTLICQRSFFLWAGFSVRSGVWDCVGSLVPFVREFDEIWKYPLCYTLFPGSVQS